MSSSQLRPERRRHRPRRPRAPSRAARPRSPASPRRARAARARSSASAGGDRSTAARSRWRSASSYGPPSAISASPSAARASTSSGSSTTALRSSRIALSRSPRRRHAMPEPAIRVGEDPAIAAGLGDRAAERRRSPVRTSRARPAPGRDRRAPPDRRRACFSARSNASCAACGSRDRQPGLAEQDQRLAVLGLGAQQRLERIDRAR